MSSAPASTGEGEAMTFGAVDAAPAAKQENAFTDMAEAALGQAEHLAPQSVKPYVKKAKQILQPLFDAIEARGPQLVYAYDVLQSTWRKVEKYQPLQYSGILVGLAMIFFGGTFATTIAAVEAFRQVGWAQTSRSMAILYDQYRIADEASRKDESSTSSGQRRTSLSALSPEERDAEIRRRAKLILKAVDPEEISGAVRGVWSGVFAVICALRIKFAHAVTLGASIGDMTTGLMRRYAEPVLNEAVSPELRKWTPIAIGWISRCIAVSLAWILQRVIVAFHSALRGSNLFLGGVTKVLVEKKLVQAKAIPPRGSARYNALMWGIAGFGFMWQLKSGFSLPFPLNVLLLPLSMFESTLALVVGTWPAE